MFRRKWCCPARYMWWRWDKIEVKSTMLLRWFVAVPEWLWNKQRIQVESLEKMAS
uniref:Transposase n=1 Tax=Ascaris lumbricoides TaxID=6252 RepID=A0A0M3IX47_ASCLU